MLGGGGSCGWLTGTECSAAGRGGTSATAEVPAAVELASGLSAADSAMVSGTGISSPSIMASAASATEADVSNGGASLSLAPLLEAPPNAAAAASSAAGAAGAAEPSGICGSAGAAAALLPSVSKPLTPPFPAAGSSDTDDLAASAAGDSAWLPPLAPASTTAGAGDSGSCCGTAGCSLIAPEDASCVPAEPAAATGSAAPADSGGRCGADGIALASSDCASAGSWPTMPDTRFITVVSRPVLTGRVPVCAAGMEARFRRAASRQLLQTNAHAL